MEEQIDEIIFEGVAEELQRVLPPGITLHIKIEEEATSDATWPTFSLVFIRAENSKVQKCAVDIRDGQIDICRLRFSNIDSSADSYYLDSYDLANPEFPDNLIKDTLKNLRDEIWQ